MWVLNRVSLGLQGGAWLVTAWPVLWEDFLCRLGLSSQGRPPPLIPEGGMGGVAAAWHRALLRRAGRSWSSVSGCASLAGAAPHPQFQLCSLLRSQKFTTDPCSSPTLPFPGCVTLGRSPLLSESLAQKKGSDENNHGHIVGLRTEPLVTCSSKLAVPRDDCCIPSLPQNSQLLLSLNVLHTKV